ncbi:MAG: branched-chain amino acid transporter permease [Tractidigestivibacter sp.]|uniref:branched-chain amino acid transporter permease n=1 Tax=Tractidigestivibacter sp. TaxID=2847320 RepID=UPI003D8D18BC
MSSTEIALTLGVALLGTVLTRFLPYVLVPSGKKTPQTITYLGRVLAPAVFGLLVVYCLRTVSPTSGTHGIPEAISLFLVWLTYRWRRSMMGSMIVGTAVYMLLVRLVFVA